MTSIRFSFCGGESVTPHYIWQSNLFLIISVGLRKEKTPANLRRHSAQKGPMGSLAPPPLPPSLQPGVFVLFTFELVDAFLQPEWRDSGAAAFLEGHE